jgi:hypothetical protein
MVVLANKNPILGEAANSWLREGRSGKILANVNHATYLLTEQGELIWMATPESPRHRRCILWPGPLPNLIVGSTFRIRDGSICPDSETMLDLRASEIWIAAIPRENDVIEIEILPDKLAGIVSTFLEWKTPVGFGLFIPPILQIARKQDVATGSQFENIQLSTAWQIVERITRACLRNDSPQILMEAEALIGLGEGLTPAGDDFLGGLFFACILISYSYPSIHFWEPVDLPGWVDTQRSRINQISYTLLKDNSNGHALEPLNRFGIALLTNQTLEDAVSAASDLINVGHSTGWSLLAGFVTGLLLAFAN